MVSFEHMNSIHTRSIDFVQVFVLGFNVVSVNAQEKMAFPEYRNSIHICSIDFVQVFVLGFHVVSVNAQETWLFLNKGTVLIYVQLIVCA